MPIATVMKQAYHTDGCAVEILRSALGEHGGMAETEVVSRFKEFAPVRLLVVLREVGSAGLSKQTGVVQPKDGAGELDRVLGNLIAHE